MTDDVAFDLEAFRTLASATSEPRDELAAKYASYNVDIFNVFILTNSARLHLREAGKARGVDMFVNVTAAGLITLLEAINRKCLDKLREEMASHMQSERERLKYIDRNHKIFMELVEMEKNKIISHKVRLILMKMQDLPLLECDEEKEDEDIKSEVERKIQEE